MNSSDIASSQRQIANLSGEVALTSRDYEFVDHAHPDHFFDSGPRPLRLIRTLPLAETYHNAIYVQATRAYKPFDGCLYGEGGQRIEASCIWRSRDDSCMTAAPDTFSGEVQDLPTYDRPLLYLGYFNQHYGHFLLETLSHWWPLAQDFADVDRFLIHVHDPSVLERPYIQASLSAAGICREQLVYFERPVRIKSVIVPQASFQLESHAFKAYRELWTKLTDVQLGREVKTTSQPLYVSRRLLQHGVKRYEGEDKIEAFLQSKGVRVVHPQQLPFAEQVRMFNEHSQIFGIMGSGMHNIVFSLFPKRVVYLTSHWINPSCFLIDKCFDADSVYLQACKGRDHVVSLVNAVLQKTRLKQRTRTAGFLEAHQLDDKRVIDWFAHSGLL